MSLLPAVYVLVLFASLSSIVAVLVAVDDHLEALANRSDT